MAKRLFRKEPSWGKLPRQVRVHNRELPFVCKLGSKRACDRSVHPPHTHAGRQQNSPPPEALRIKIRKTKADKPNAIPPDVAPSVHRASVRHLRNSLRGQRPASQRPPSIMNGPVIPSETSGIRQKWNTKKKACLSFALARRTRCRRSSLLRKESAQARFHAQF